MATPSDEPTAHPLACQAEMAGMTSELQRVNRAHRTLSAGNRTLLRASDEQELLREMCRVIVEAGYAMACVAYAVHDEKKSIQWRASLGMDIESLEALHFTWDDTEFGNSLPGAAIRTGQPVVNKHITDSEYAGAVFAPVREIMGKMGLRSATSFPLNIAGEVIGALVIVAVELNAFDQEELSLLNELADDLAYGIANLRTRALHREAQATITRLAYQDSLTGLPNRTLLVDILDTAMQAAKEQHRPLALLHLEVKHFHDINKMLGFRAGDELMKILSQRLAHENVENDAPLARVGEAEFALMLPNCGAENACLVARRLLSAIEGPVEVSGLPIHIHVGIGIALFPGHAADAEVLIRRASAATQRNAQERSGYTIYSTGQEKENTRRLTLMGDLSRAIKRNELLLYCQPKIDIASRVTCGAEALVRWVHPVYGMVSTMEFVQLAEQAGTITPLTNWMLEAAFSQSYAWREGGLQCPLAINLSAQDLYDPGLIDRIRGMFLTWGIAPDLIQFELTEGTFMADPNAALATLASLKNLGVQLFVDDYGTGYSSLSYLKELPVDALKIDKSFVTPMTEKCASAVIVKSTIELGHNLGLKIVAEGVESQDVWGHLATAGCDVAQGFLISRPMPAQQFLAWDEKWRYTLGSGDAFSLN